MATSPTTDEVTLFDEAHSCRLCREPRLAVLLDLGAFPIAHRFLSEPRAPEYTHDVRLRCCLACGLTQLVAPIPPELLYTNYVCLSSWKPQPHVGRLLELLAGLPGLGPASRILEIGSNDGMFLGRLREAGYASLVGLEPAEDAVRASVARGLTTVPSYLTPSSAAAVRAEHGPFDLVVARQVLEHVGDLQGFASALGALLAPGGHVLIEVPNFDFALATSDYSSIWEEHINYFTVETLRRFLAVCGVTITHHETANFSGEALIVVGERRGRVAETQEAGVVNRLGAAAVAFGSGWPSWRDTLDRRLQEHRDGGGRVAVYGAGCRACSLINFAGLRRHIDFVLDDQREKQGLYMPGSRLPIVPGDALEGSPVDLCLLAVNAENEEAVMAKHTAFVGRGGRFASLHPPSPRLYLPGRLR